MTTPSIRDALRDPAKHKMLPGLIARESSGTHCQTFDLHLLSLVRNELISIDAAHTAASNPAELMRLYRLNG